MAVSPQTGIDVLLKVNTGTEQSPVWTTVAMQRGAKLNRSAETIEASYKGSGAWKTYLTGFKEWSVECDGLYVLGATEFKKLEDAFANGTPIEIEFVDSNNKGWKGSALITEFPIDAPYDGELTYSVTLQGTGALTSL